MSCICVTLLCKACCSSQGVATGRLKTLWPSITPMQRLTPIDACRTRYVVCDVAAYRFSDVTQHTAAFAAAGARICSFRTAHYAACGIYTILHPAALLLTIAAACFAYPCIAKTVPHCDCKAYAAALLHRAAPKHRPSGGISSEMNESTNLIPNMRFKPIYPTRDQRCKSGVGGSTL
jgi:hypothetical protein